MGRQLPTAHVSGASEEPGVSAGPCYDEARRGRRVVPGGMAHSGPRRTEVTPYVYGGGGADARCLRNSRAVRIGID